MRRLLRHLAVVLIASVSGCAMRTSAAPSSTERARDAIHAVRYVGRFDWRDSAGPRYAWSASTMHARFRGRAVALHLRAAPVPPLPKGGSPTEHETPYTVVLDGTPTTILVGPTKERYPLAQDLDPNRVHEVSVVREAEAMAGVHQFLGFEVEGELLDPPPPRPYSVEIVGDSITCGYGDLGHDKTCGFSYATERASVAYGAIAGERLGADVTTVCWSGLGVLRNYDGTRSPTMPELFERALPESQDSSWFSRRLERAPDAVVVALGTNDMEESTKTRLDIDAFESRYVAFLGRIRQVYPDAWIFVAESPMLPPEPSPTGPGLLRDLARGAFTRVVAARQKSGDQRVDFLELPWQEDRLGCDWHPSQEMHRILGERLATSLRSKLGARGRP